MRGANPVDMPELWDTFLLAGRRSPGLCKFPTLPKRDEGWDVQVPKGTTGGNTIHNNQPPVKFSVELRLWKDDKVDHFARWEDWKDILQTPVKANDPKALDIWHPQLEGLKIRSVVVASRAEYVPDGYGGARVTWDFLEYRPPATKKAQAPAGSKSSSTTKKNDPNADLKKEIEELTVRFRKAGQP